MSNPFKVIIIGGGTGGLCLAQGLKADGIAVDVFERERTPIDRRAGYRLSISPTGNRALEECLPETLFQKLVMSSARPSRGVSVLDERLKPLLTVDLPESDPKSVDCERPISRIALRRILVQGSMRSSILIRNSLASTMLRRAELSLGLTMEQPPPVTCWSAPMELTLTFAPNCFLTRKERRLVSWRCRAKLG
jgi:hypothetical protein